MSLQIGSSDTLVNPNSVIPNGDSSAGTVNASGAGAPTTTNATGNANAADATTSIPHSLDAEQAMLGALLISPHLMDRVAHVVSAEDFFAPLHGEIFDSMRGLLESGRVATAITLEPLLNQTDGFVESGGMDYLTYLAAAAPPVSSAVDLANLIVELATRRRLVTIGEDIVIDARNTATDLSPTEQIEAAERRLYSIAETERFGGGFQGFGEATTTALHVAQQAYKRPGGLTGISTGLVDLDKTLGGLQSSDLIILAGRPSMGKTALATDIAVSVARNVALAREKNDADMLEMYNGCVGFFSLEMSAEQLATRVISSQSRISSSDIRRGTISASQFDEVIQTARDLDSMPMFIDETGGLTVGQLAARARRLKRQHGLCLIVIDYLQLLRGSRTKASDSRTQEVTEITTTLKALAKELNVPIIAAAQLSRQVENREGNRPQLSDLRESGSIEQDADVVMFVYRREYYLERSKPNDSDTEALATWQRDSEIAHGKAEVVIGKQRHGPTGTVHLAFHSRTTRFADYTDAGGTTGDADPISHDLG